MVLALSYSLQCIYISCIHIQNIQLRYKRNGSYWHTAGVEEEAAKEHEGYYDDGRDGQGHVHVWRDAGEEVAHREDNLCGLNKNGEAENIEMYKVQLISHIHCIYIYMRTIE